MYERAKDYNYNRYPLLPQENGGALRAPQGFRNPYLQSFAECLAAGGYFDPSGGYSTIERPGGKGPRYVYTNLAGQEMVGERKP